MDNYDALLAACEDYVPGLFAPITEDDRRFTQLMHAAFDDVEYARLCNTADSSFIDSTIPASEF